MTNKAVLLFFFLFYFATLFAQFDASFDATEAKRALLLRQQPVTDEYLSSLDAATFTNLVLEASILAQGERADSIAHYVYRRNDDKKGYVMTLLSLSSCLLTWGGDYPSALHYYQKGVSMLPEDAQNDFDTLEQCLLFWDYYLFYLDESDSELLRKSWDASVQSNLLLMGLCSNNFSQCDEQTVHKLLNTYQKLYQKTLELYGSMSKAQLLSTEDMVHWAEYSMFWESLRTPNSLPPLTFKEMQQQLQPGEMAVHLTYQETRSIDFDAAAIVIPYQGDVFSTPLDLTRAAFIPLLRSKAFSPTHEERRERINHPHNSGRYFNSFWDPFYERYPDVRTIYYSTMGQIGFMSHAAFAKDRESSTRLCDEKDMRLLSSLNELGNNRQSSPLKDIAIFGDINYYNQAVESTDVATCAVRRTVTTRADKLMRLPFSQYEVNQLKLMLANGKINSSYYTNRQATETTFLALSGNSPQVIHFSTLGFYMEEVPFSSKSVSLYDYDPAVEQQYRIENQNRACGLFLAGAGHSWNDEKSFLDNADDGVLTAAEIASMDLRNTELVVLSACNTAMGYFEQTQNIVGLWRAFKQAGVKSILMTLWEVEDKVAAEMMLSFYKHWLATSDMHQAFRLAQKEIRARYPEPYDWGAFVLMD